MKDDRAHFESFLPSSIEIAIAIGIAIEIEGNGVSRCFMEEDLARRRGGGLKPFKLVECESENVLTLPVHPYPVLYSMLCLSYPMVFN